jgi:hypothetical protein
MGKFASLWLWIWPWIWCVCTCMHMYVSIFQVLIFMYFSKICLFLNYIKSFIIQWFYYKRKCWKLSSNFHVFLAYVHSYNYKIYSFSRFHRSILYMYMKPINHMPSPPSPPFTPPKVSIYTVPILCTAVNFLKMYQHILCNLFSCILQTLLLMDRWFFSTTLRICYQWNIKYILFFMDPTFL